MAEQPPKSEQAKKKMRRADPAFEMIVLGSGGGPLETDCSGYLVKPYHRRWEDGFVGLEGGLGSLSELLANGKQQELFPDVRFPQTHNTPVLRAAYIFSHLTCYLITHAHLDHIFSLVLLTGSIPPRSSTHDRSPLPSPPLTIGPTATTPTKGPPAPRPPVYGTHETLKMLAHAYEGDLWPELGSWAPEGTEGEKKREELEERGTDHVRHKKRRFQEMAEDARAKGSGVTFTPLAPSSVHRPLHPQLPIANLAFPVSHGSTSHGLYPSSAMFIRYDPAAMTELNMLDSQPSSPANETSTFRLQVDKPMLDPEQEAHQDREFLFFGDLSSAYRSQLQEDVAPGERDEAARLNTEIWKAAAVSWREGRLAGVFMECSYDSSRPAHLMFGHLSPPSLYHELNTLAALIDPASPTGSLTGLRIFITHIKESLVPTLTGKPARETIMAELRELEEEGKLGVVFVEVRKGDRILI